jgi:protein TonB
MISHLVFYTSEVLASIFLMSVLLVLIVYAAKLYFSLSGKNGAKTIDNKIAKNGISSRTKYPQYDIFRYRPLILKFSFCVALASSIIIISWTNRDARMLSSSWDNENYNVYDIIELIPKTKHKKPPKLENIIFDDMGIEELFEEIEDFEEIDMEIDFSDFKPTEFPIKTAQTPPPPPLPVKEDAPAIIKIAEQMPRFPGCEEMGGTNKEKEECAKKKLLEYIYSKLKYPPWARENRVEGTAVVSFVVDIDGSIVNIELLRDPGGGIGEAAIKTVESMNSMPEKWTPGKQNGRKVKVLYTLPVRFRLE